MTRVRKPPVGIFGVYLESLRTQRNWSQREVAQRAGIDHTYYYKIIRGEMDPPSSVILQRFARIFEVSEEEFFKRSGKLLPQMKRMLRSQPYLAELLYALSQHPLPESGYKALLVLVQDYA